MERLAELRQQRALTLRDLEQMSGVAADTINQVELGHRKARPSTIRKLAKALNVDPSELMGGDGAPKARSRPSGEWLAKAWRFIRRFDRLDERDDLDYSARVSAVSDGAHLLNRSRYLRNSSLAQRELTTEEFEDHFEALSRIAEIVEKAADTLRGERAEEDVEGSRTA